MHATPRARGAVLSAASFVCSTASELNPQYFPDAERLLVPLCCVVLCCVACVLCRVLCCVVLCCLCVVSCVVLCCLCVVLCCLCVVLLVCCVVCCVVLLVLCVVLLVLCVVLCYVVCCLCVVLCCVVLSSAHRQLIQDDKGTVAICAFGLPYSSHEDDPLRGVLAAIGVWLCSALLCSALLCSALLCYALLV